MNKVALFVCGTGRRGSGGPDDGYGAPIAPDPQEDSADKEYYPMNGPSRGKALVFNNFEVTQPQAERAKSALDESCVKEALDGLGFEVTVMRNESSKKIRQLLRSVASEDHSNSDCLIVVLMIRGKKDKRLTSLKLWESFTPGACPTLKGKPKLFFVQVVKENGGPLTGTGRALETADVLVAESTTSGCGRSSSDVFIQVLSNEFKKNGHLADILTLVTAVNRKVAAHCQCTGKRLAPTFTSSLTRKLRFPNKTCCLETTL